MAAVGGNRRLVLIVLVAVVLVCLVGVLIFNVFVRGRGGDDVAGGEPATATAMPATEEPTPAPEEEEPAPTSTPEEEMEATATPTAETEADRQPAQATATATPLPTETPPPPPTPTQATASTVSRTIMVDVPKSGEVLENGGFEAGFGEDGVGVQWQTFRTDNVVANFMPETAEPFVYAGSHAQRISIDQATQPDRYAGIFQTVEVVPNETYTLTLRGQIRSGFGSVEASSYGYRLQYALSQRGEQNWLEVPPGDWIELPWPEQSLSDSSASYSEYTTSVTPRSDGLTLFIRGWNKWPDQTLAEYSLDGLSLVGPVPGETEQIAQTVTVTLPAAEPADSAAAPETGSSEAMIDKPLPVTGLDDGGSLLASGRFWGALLVIGLLALGAVYRAGWRW